MVKLASIYQEVSSESWLIGVGDVEETVRVFSWLVDLGHEGVTLQNESAIDEKVQGIFLWKSDSLSNNESELIRSQVTWCQVPKIDKNNKEVS